MEAWEAAHPEQWGELWDIWPERGDNLSGRIRNFLLRRGLTRRDRIAATPDRALLIGRNIGPVTVRAIRERVPYVPPAPTPLRREVIE